MTDGREGSSLREWTCGPDLSLELTYSLPSPTHPAPYPTLKLGLNPLDRHRTSLRGTRAGDGRYGAVATSLDGRNRTLYPTAGGKKDIPVLHAGPLFPSLLRVSLRPTLVFVTLLFPQGTPYRPPSVGRVGGVGLNGVVTKGRSGITSQRVITGQWPLTSIQRTLTTPKPSTLTTHPVASTDVSVTA